MFIRKLLTIKKLRRFQLWTNLCSRNVNQPNPKKPHEPCYREGYQHVHRISVYFKKDLRVPVMELTPLLHARVHLNGMEVTRGTRSMLLRGTKDYPSITSRIECAKTIFFNAPRINDCLDKQQFSPSKKACRRREKNSLRLTKMMGTESRLDLTGGCL